jgi:hypothetical protein
MMSTLLERHSLFFLLLEVIILLLRIFDVVLRIFYADDLLLEEFGLTLRLCLLPRMEDQFQHSKHRLGYERKHCRLV